MNQSTTGIGIGKPKIGRMVYALSRQYCRKGEMKLGTIVTGKIEQPASRAKCPLLHEHAMHAQIIIIIAEFEALSPECAT